MNNDLISRAALLSDLNELYMAALRKDGVSVESIYELDHLSMLVNDAPAVDAAPMDFHERCLQFEIQKRFAAEKAAPKWISVEDRLPEDCMNVLVYAIGNNENDVVAMTSYTHNMYGYNIEGWCSPWQYFFYEYKITHWMPLPEPPKMDGDKDGK